MRGREYVGYVRKWDTEMGMSDAALMDDTGWSVLYEEGERGQGQMGLMKPIGQPEFTSLKFSFSPNLPC